MPAKKSSIVNVKLSIVKPQTNLSIPVYSITGAASGSLTLPKEVFGQEVNKGLLAQAVRVYTANQKNYTASTKTRGQVQGSTVKIYRQKGTGRARHGANTAPIFVGGGITFGPKPRKVVLDLPKKMKRAALISALSDKANEKLAIAVDNVEKLTGKTKQVTQFLQKVMDKNTKSALIVTASAEKNLQQAVRNIPNVTVLSANLINIYEVLRHQTLILTKDAVSKLETVTKKVEKVVEEEIKKEEKKEKKKA